MSVLDDIIIQIELHSVEGIRRCFESGLDPNIIYRDEPLIYELISEYTRTNRFSDCGKLFIDYGLIFEDDLLLAVLINDHRRLDQLLEAVPAAVNKKYTLRCAYTPLYQVTLLHVCAEFNLTACAEVLVKYGADVNAPAGSDEYGFGGQTPVFHTVNQNSNHSMEMLHYLLSQRVNLTSTVKGLTWGKGYEWETLIPAVNPISYAMMGLLPQMHRDEQSITGVVTLLLKHAYDIDYVPPNVPCKYLLK